MLPMNEKMLKKLQKFLILKYIKLILLKNIWGLKEWNGAWSDESDEVEIYREELFKLINEANSGKVTFKEDGKFLMSYEDFIKDKK